MRDPQQFYVAPQTENLEQLYRLVGQLTELVRANSARRDAILCSVDQRALVQGGPATVLQDMACFDNFLSTVDGDRTTPAASPQAGANAESVVERLRAQNERLRAVLGSARQNTCATADLLDTHQDALAEVLGHLRTSVVDSHFAAAATIRDSYATTLYPVQDREFKAYISNIDNVDLAAHIARIYMTIMQLKE